MKPALWVNRFGQVLACAAGVFRRWRLPGQRGGYWSDWVPAGALDEFMIPAEDWEAEQALYRLQAQQWGESLCTRQCSTAT